MMQTDWQHVTDWTAAYDNRAAVPTHEEFFYAWGRDAAAFRAGRAPEEIAYGSGARERLDLFRPDGAAQGLVVFMHGGWWSHFGREYFSHLAAGPLARGWAVAMPSYTLCPDTSIGGIVGQMVRAVSSASEAAVDGPMVITGHSAGGHLSTVMGAQECGLPEAAATRLTRIVSISGIADLRPLMRVAMNSVLKIDPEHARQFSPLFLTPRGGYDYVAWVGAEETAEFRRQNALLADSWGAEVSSRRVEAEGRNHFDVIADLSDADSALTQLVAP